MGLNDLNYAFSQLLTESYIECRTIALFPKLNPAAYKVYTSNCVGLKEVSSLLICLPIVVLCNASIYIQYIVIYNCVLLVYRYISCMTLLVQALNS